MFVILFINLIIHFQFTTDKYQTYIGMMKPRHEQIQTRVLILHRYSFRLDSNQSFYQNFAHRFFPKISVEFFDGPNRFYRFFKMAAISNIERKI